MLSPGEPWLPRWRRAHGWLLTGLAAAATLAAGPLGGLSASSQLALLAGAVALIALPHGAVDPWVAPAALRSTAGRPRWLAFGIGYLGVAALVPLVWAVAPWWALAGFLTVSTLHFGLEDRDPGLLSERAGALEVLARGGLPIAAPMLWHGEACAQLFGLLAGEGSPAVLARVTSQSELVGGAWLVLFSSVAARHAFGAIRTRDPRHLATLCEMLALLAAFVSLPPLLAFALYFCAGHSLRHTLGVAALFDARSPRRALGLFARRAAPLTLATLALGILAWTVLRGQVEALAAGLNVVFIGLAALTAPHLLLRAWTLREAARPALRPGDAALGGLEGA